MWCTLSLLQPKSMASNRYNRTTLLWKSWSTYQFNYQKHVCLYIKKQNSLLEKITQNHIECYIPVTVGWIGETLNEIDTGSKGSNTNIGRGSSSDRKHTLIWWFWVRILSTRIVLLLRWTRLLLLSNHVSKKAPTLQQLSS